MVDTSTKHNYPQKAHYTVPIKLCSNLELKATVFLRKLRACYAAFKQQL